MFRRPLFCDLSNVAGFLALHVWILCSGITPYVRWMTGFVSGAVPSSLMVVADFDSGSEGFLKIRVAGGSVSSNKSVVGVLMFPG